MFHLTETQNVTVGELVTNKVLEFDDIEVDSQMGQFCFGVGVDTDEDINFGAGVNTVADVDSVINTVSMM